MCAGMQRVEGKKVLRVFSVGLLLSDSAQEEPPFLPTLLAELVSLLQATWNDQRHLSCMIRLRRELEGPRLELLPVWASEPFQGNR